MGLLIELRIHRVLKTENGIPTVGRGIAHRVKRTTFAIKTEDGMPTPWHCPSNYAYNVCHKDRKRCT